MTRSIFGASASGRMSAAEPVPGRYHLQQLDARALTHAETFAQGRGRAQDEVRIVGGDRRVGADELETSVGRGLEGERVAEGDGLEDRAYLVVAVGAPAVNAQAEVDLGEGRDVYLLC